MEDDVWTQLRQKDNDLVLAAELGKALLEKNEELQRQHDSALEEFSKKVEVLEQDKHVLKRKLASAQSEAEARTLELQNDVAELAEKLAAKEQALKQWEKDKGALLGELGAQNARLTGQLKESALLEAQLQQEVLALREQCAMGKSSVHQHVATVDTLREELDIAAHRKNELERRLHAAASERDSFASALDEAADRILLLERHAREQELRYQHNLQEHSLPSPPETPLKSDNNTQGHHRSLLAEMDVSEPTLSQECMAVYRQLRSLCQQLKTHTDDDSGLHSDCSNISIEDGQRFSAGLLSEVAQELVALVLDTDVVRLLERLDQARRDIHERDLELQARTDALMELTSKVSVREVELQAALEDRDRARGDASNSSLAQDEAVCKARQVRDQAVARRNKLEVELAKTRVDLMQANSQLLGVVQQKVELSQQLEQWQMDMKELIDEQLRTKLIPRQQAPAPQAPTAPPRRIRLLGFFQR